VENFVQQFAAGLESSMGCPEPMVRLAQVQTISEETADEWNDDGGEPSTIDDVVAKLSSRDVYFSHGSVIDHVEAAALGLKVEYLKPEDPIWQRIWLLFCMYEHDCRRARYLKVFEGATRRTAVAISPPTPPA
jgi:hypothetical protein